MKKILFIDDQPSDHVLQAREMKEACRKALRGTTELIQALSWEDGTTRLSEGDIDVVLLDLSLSDSGRDETVVNLSSVARDWPPVVILTGWVNDEDLRRRCFSAGCYYFIEKSPQGIIGVFNACLNAWYHRMYHPHPKT